MIDTVVYYGTNVPQRAASTTTSNPVHLQRSHQVARRRSGKSIVPLDNTVWQREGHQSRTINIWKSLYTTIVLRKVIHRSVRVSGTARRASKLNNEYVESLARKILGNFPSTVLYVKCSWHITGRMPRPNDVCRQKNSRKHISTATLFRHRHLLLVVEAWREQSLVALLCGTTAKSAKGTLPLLVGATASQCIPTCSRHVCLYIRVLCSSPVSSSERECKLPETIPSTTSL